MPPTDDAITQFHENQLRWITRLATGELNPHPQHPRVMMAEGSIAVRTGRNGVIMLPMDQSDADPAAHDDLLRWLRSSDLADVLVWSMEANPIVDLSLLAQGYQPGFEPWWMTRNLASSFQRPLHPVSIATGHDIDKLMRSQVPYIMADQIETMLRLTQRADPSVAWLVAHHGRDVIGQAIVHTTGDHAGLFNVGVDGRYRRKGVGTSLTLAAMAIAKDAGATTMNLNSTPQGEHVYKRVGFRRIGTGQTWSLPHTRSRWNPSDELQRAVIALGTGDTAALNGDRLPTRFANTLTAQQIACRFRQVDTVRWLLAQGQTPEIVTMWQAGMKEDALAAVADPEAREWRGNPRQATPLHLAAEAGAGSLVIALIEAGADLTARDTEYNATPLDWAHACNKPTIARVIRNAGGR